MAGWSLNTDGRGAHLFRAILVDRALPAVDSHHRSVARRLTIAAKKNLEASILREQERGKRKRSRLTGTLTGHSGRRSAIQGNALNPGGLGEAQGRGVGWPRVDILERRARHWRALEFGTPYVTMPIGLFVRDGKAVRASDRTSTDIFMTYKDFLRARRLRRGTTPLTRRQKRARQRATLGYVLRRRRGSGIEAKHFLENAWDEIVGPDGSKAFKEEVDILRKVFEEFRR